MAITRKRFVLFAILSSVLVLVGAMGVALAADLLLHRRAERSAGLNRWGYRGPVVASKRAGEVRAVMLGGSTVFGYGVTAEESIPAYLEQRLNESGAGSRWSVVNLGYNTEGAYAFVPNLQDFAFLDYDVVILYEGYNDLLGDEAPNLVTVRQQSPLFRSTGYFPILPLWLREKALVLRTGSVAAGYDKPDGRTVFQPGLAGRASASALEAAASVASSLEQQLKASDHAENQPLTIGPLGCSNPWLHFCESYHRAIRHVLATGKRVLVVAQPNVASGDARLKHQSQRQALEQLIQRHFGSEPRVAYFALEDRVNLLDLDVSFDQMHLSVDGNKIVAAALVEPVVKLWSAQ